MLLWGAASGVGLGAGWASPLHARSRVNPSQSARPLASASEARRYSGDPASTAAAMGGRSLRLT